jgi:hypothetical protein
LSSCRRRSYLTLRRGVSEFLFTFSYLLSDLCRNRCKRSSPRNGVRQSCVP